MTNASTSPDVLSLFGDDDQTPVERAIAEMRAGRAVLIACDGGLFAVVGAEFATAEVLGALARIGDGKVSLLLSAARLHFLGDDTDRQSHAVDAAGLTAERIDDLLRRPDAALDLELHPAGPAAEAGLSLLRLALLLPGALIASVPPERAAALNAARVSAEAVLRYAKTRRRTVSIVSRAPVPLFTARKAEFVVFRGGEGLREQIAVIVGKPDPAEPVPVRLHSACITGDLFGSLRCDCGDQLRGAVQVMAEHGGGVLLYLDQEGRGNGIANKIRAYCLQYEGFDTYEADEALGLGADNRSFEFAAEMLRQIGYPRVSLLTNSPAKAAALRDAGIDVVDTQRVYGKLNAENIGYLTAKRDRAGHLVDPDELIATDR